MVNNNNRYGGANRNLWRRFYPTTTRREPSNITIVDPVSGKTNIIDLNRTFQHRDYYELVMSATNMAAPYVPSPFGEYDEGLIHFNNETEATAIFNVVFTNIPYVVFTTEEAATNNGSQYVNIYGIQKATNLVSVGISAPYSGTIRYRAVYSPTYPVTCTTAYTASIICSAGNFITAYDTAYTASFNSLSSVPLLFLQSPYDGTTLSGSNVSLMLQTLADGSATTEITAPVSAAIDFIAYKTL